MAVLLVRHAHALSRSGWTEDDTLRPLSERGRAQAENLVGRLREYKPARLLSSPYLRCIDTLRPLGADLELEVDAADALAEGASGAALRLVREVMGTNAVLCSHGDVIPAVLEVLAKEDRLDLGRDPRNEKASVWVLESRKSRFTKASYLRPPRRSLA